MFNINCTLFLLTDNAEVSSTERAEDNDSIIEIIDQDYITQCETCEPEPYFKYSSSPIPIVKELINPEEELVDSKEISTVHNSDNGKVEIQ